MLMSFSFIISFFFEILIALSFAEICSAFPKNGSCYYWTRKLINNKYKYFISYIVGCFYVGGPLFAAPVGNI